MEGGKRRDVELGFALRNSRQMQVIDSDEHAL